ncbi:extracellular solute-binding protein [Parenemella sanctibonifatiensis]|uniref:Extracellular solute-binding protein n=1 Tax=Parenemella sanctibonifatiensis TaxID=2016505 RepID=A0A255DZ36_9ACTN|nr:extracellular solute-binding protein [Parenemella sanctibonifatiensis]OYN84609.1 hypothetical protein CGZ92_12285 [Parenemella sanctibonifatiensis]
MAVSRRNLLAGIGLAGMTLGAGTLAGCSTDGGAGGGDEPRAGSQQAGTQMPAYVPFEGAEPDLPGDPDLGVPPAYFAHPADVEPMRDNLPLPETDPIHFLASIGVEYLPGSNNPWYDMLSTEIGNKFELIAGGAADYLNKYQVQLASNDLPEAMMMLKVAQFPQLLDAKMTDLTPFLSGDAIKEYPGLASILPETWMIPMVNGKIWGIPQQRPPAGQMLQVRGDLMEQRGLPLIPEPANGEEFRDLLKEVSGGGNFALGQDPIGSILEVTLQMMGANNGWGVAEDGTFSHALESEIYIEALDVASQLWADGVMHPDSISNAGNVLNWQQAGVTSMVVQQFTAWVAFARRFPTWNLSYVSLPKWEGGGEANIYKSAPGFGNFVGIPKQDSEERVKEILRVFDYVASPFGTKEYLNFIFGIEGKHWDRDAEGNAQTNAEGRAADWFGGLEYAGSREFSQVYIPGNEELTTRQHTYLKEKLPTGVADASLGLYSETATTEGAAMDTQLKDARHEIIRGNRSASTWTDIVQEWRRRSGDESRIEYQEAYAQLNG